MPHKLHTSVGCSLFFPKAIAAEWKMVSANFCCRKSSSKLQQQLIVRPSDKP